MNHSSRAASLLADRGAAFSRALFSDADRVAEMRDGRTSELSDFSPAALATLA